MTEPCLLNLSAPDVGMLVREVLVREATVPALVVEATVSVWVFEAMVPVLVLEACDDVEIAVLFPVLEVREAVPSEAVSSTETVVC
jgi:hypothetical protein